MLSAMARSTTRALKALRWALAIAGAAACAVTAGRLDVGAPLGLTTRLGEARVVDGELWVQEGAWLVFGEGTAIEVELPLHERELDITMGPPDDVAYFAHVTPELLSLHDGSGAALRPGYSPKEVPNEPASVGLRCGPPLMLDYRARKVEMVDADRVLNHQDRKCRPVPLGVRAGTDLRLTAVRVDGKDWPIEGLALDRAVAGSVAAGLAALVALLGPAGFPVLLLAPAAPLLEGLAGLGLPAAAALWLLVGAGASERLVGGAGWRRWLGALVSAIGLVMAVRSFVATIGPIGIEALDSENTVVASALEATMGIEAYRSKIETAVEYYSPQLARRDPDKPLVVTLGSSSTGGNHPEGFWPGVLAEQLPEVYVQTLAWGGATSWHMVRILRAFDLRPDACVIYMGHNDTLHSMPGQSLASLERGDPPYSDTFVAPVPLPEARENLAEIGERCGLFVGMQEYSVGREAELAEYAALMEALPGVHYLDVTPILSARPYSQMMVDPVHPSFAGQELIGARVAEELRALMALE
jgi:lysophospholipase L1-like esterase